VDDIILPQFIPAMDIRILLFDYTQVNVSTGAKIDDRLILKINASTG
jgi:hypothetical protein